MIKTVGLLLLALLKIVGWILLILFLLLLTVLLLVLFVPVRYRMAVQNERSMEPFENNPVKNLRVQVKVTWLLHFIQFFVLYSPKKTENGIKIAGVDVKKVLARFSKQKESGQGKKTSEIESDQIPYKDESSEPEKDADCKNPAKKFSPENITNSEHKIDDFSPDEGIPIIEERTPGITIEGKKDQDIDIEAALAEDVTAPIHSQKELAAKSKKQKGRKNGRKKEQKRKEKKKKEKKERNKKARKKVRKEETKENNKNKTSNPGTIKTLLEKASQLYKEWKDETNRHAISRLWKELCFLIRSYRPRKVKADITFSLANPAVTGEVLGFISMFPFIYRHSYNIVPDFTSEKLYIEGELLLEGKVTVCKFIISLLRLVCDKEFMKLVRRFMGRGKA